MPAAVSAFLLTLATVDDLGAILVIAVFFAGSLKVGFLTGAAALTARGRDGADRAAHGRGEREGEHHLFAPQEELEGVNDEP